MLLGSRSGAFDANYHLGKVNICPTCGQNNWWIGRTSAECGTCATALALLETGIRGSGTHSRNKRPVWNYDWAVD